MSKQLTHVSVLQKARTALLDSAIDKIEAAIKQAEASGHRRTTYYLRANDPVSDILMVIEAGGYTGKLRCERDPRDGDSNFIEITWK